MNILHAYITLICIKNQTRKCKEGFFSYHAGMFLRITKIQYMKWNISLLSPKEKLILKRVRKNLTR